MRYKRRKFDTVMLAVALFTLSGAILAYNLRTVGSGELAVSLSELTDITAKDSLISDAAMANLTTEDSVFAAASPSAPPRDYEILAPIITRPLS
ncbi:MAG: hypothetical protein E7632_00050 [Ruminococcaceae bacterium]|nr:hypothetical protein [Oscillospiraceae bacterium]